MADRRPPAHDRTFEYQMPDQTLEREKLAAKIQPESRFLKHVAVGAAVYLPSQT